MYRAITLNPKSVLSKGGRIYVSNIWRGKNDNYVWVLKWDFNTHINRCIDRRNWRVLQGANGTHRAINKCSYRRFFV